jgi:protocatechuate 3,4-dioxygenase beta subunit
MSLLFPFLFVAFLMWQQPQTTSMQGTVVKLGSNEPVAGITVEVRRAAAQPLLAGSAVTGADGNFLVQGLLPGEYHVIAIDPSGKYVRTEYLQRNAHGSGVVATLTGEGLRDLRIAMPQSGSISGRVVDSNGEPAVNARVMALEAVYRDGQPVFSILQALRTNDSGEYRLFWLPPGQYFVAVQPIDARSVPFAIQVVPAGRTVFREDGATPVVTRRTLESGQVFEEIYVTSYYGGGANPQRARAVEVGSGQHVGAIDITLTDTKVRAYHVRGTVTTTAGQPAANAVIRLVPRTYPGPYANIPNASSDAKGGYDIAGVLPGSYDLLVVLGGQLFGGQDNGGFRGPGLNLNNGTSNLVSIDVGSRDLENVKVALKPGVSISLRASVDSGSIDLAGIPIALVRDPYSLGMPNAQSTRLEIEGRTASFPGVGPGNYRVNVTNVTGLPEGTYVKSIRTGSQDVLDGGLHVTDTAGIALELVFGTNGARIDGLTQSATGEPLANVTVVLVPDAPRRGQTNLYKTTSSDRAGRFVIQAVAPGDYRLFAFESVEEDAWQNAGFLTPYEPRSRVVHAAEGGKESVQLTVISSGSRP